MAIGSAIERGSLIYVFDEHGRTLFQKALGNGSQDGLLGFTGSTVTVRFGSVIYTYDERGSTIYAKQHDRPDHPDHRRGQGGQPGQGGNSPATRDLVDHRR